MPGHDSVVFTFAKRDGIRKRFLRRLRKMWPKVLTEMQDVDSFDEDREPPQIYKLAKERHIEVLYCRDSAMKAFFEKYSYDADPSGEGPISVHFRVRTKTMFELGSVTESEKKNGPLPYPAMLCAPELLEVTLVSPRNPARDPFSKEMMHMILESI